MGSKGSRVYGDFAKDYSSVNPQWIDTNLVFDKDLENIIAQGKVPFSREGFLKLKSEIENMSAKITSKNKELASKQELLVMYNSLVDYDNGQQKVLLVFKNTAFIFAILFVALFGGLICSILFTYFAKLFYNAYTIREKDEWYFITLTNEAKAENNNQPLLGFTLLFILIMMFSGSLSFIM